MKKLLTFLTVLCLLTAVFPLSASAEQALSLSSLASAAHSGPSLPGDEIKPLSAQPGNDYGPAELSAEKAGSDTSAEASESSDEASRGLDAVDMFIFIAGGAVVLIALLMILIAYIKTRKK